MREGLYLGTADGGWTGGAWVAGSSTGVSTAGPRVSAWLLTLSLCLAFPTVTYFLTANRRVRAYHPLNHTRCPAGGMGYYSFATEKCENGVGDIWNFS